MRSIDKIIVHCSATPEGRDVSVDTIKKWHVDDNKWSDIGYHYVIELDGGVHYGRNCEISGAHCKGHNSKSIGICYVGGVDANQNPKDTRTDKQVIALHNLIKDLKTKYPDSIVYGHRDFSSKACPSFDAKSEYSDV
jgi:N-acetylmuramoyl-L-alanine amidase|tara:strand:+ start:658 stop:1068 length:411 start_codon:yes stop_codon:yes gene_type:complete